MFRDSATGGAGYGPPSIQPFLIHDFVLPTKGTQLRGTVEDILMMVILIAWKRTSEEYKGCCARAAGLEVLNIIATGGNEEAIIEAKVAKTMMPTY